MQLIKRTSLLLAGSLLISACSVRTHTPVANEIIVLEMPTDELVCHVKFLSAQVGLSFHYGTFEDSFGTATTFRLIGDGYEVTIINPERSTYDLSAYDLAKRPGTAGQALNAFEQIKGGLMAPLSEECRRRT